MADDEPIVEEPVADEPSEDDYKCQKTTYTEPIKKQTSNSLFLVKFDL